MAQKELRKMNRTELIEIIYALQQNEKSLRSEMEELRARLDEKLLRIESAGSIAEAALSLNHLFEDAQLAAQQYVLSVQEANVEAAAILNRAKDEAAAIRAEARRLEERNLAWQQEYAAWQTECRDWQDRIARTVTGFEATLCELEQTTGGSA